MAITRDNSTEHVRTLTTSPQTWSHAGAASGVKGVIVAIVHGSSSTDHVSAVSYGGSALSRVVRTTDTVTEPGAAELWFLGTSVPQGTQTVSYTPGTTTNDIHAVCTTFLAATDLSVIDFDSVSADASGGTLANPSLTLQNATGESTMAYAALYGGGASPGSFTPNANCSTLHDEDLGNFYSEVICQTTASTGATFDIGGTSSADDVAFVAALISEQQAAKTASPAGVALSLTGGTPTATSIDPITKEPTSGALAFAAGTVSLAIGIAVTGAALSLSGGTPSVSVDSPNLGGRGSGLLLALSELTAPDRYVSPSSGSLSLSGNIPDTNIGYVLNPTTATVTLTGGTPSVAATPPDGVAVAPQTGSVSLTGGTPERLVNHVSLPQAVNLALTGGSPTTGVVAADPGGGGPGLLLALNLNLEVIPQVKNPTSGSLSFTGGTPGLSWDVQGYSGSLTFTGGTPARDVGFNTAPTTGSLTFTGGTPTALAPITVNPTSGSLSLSGGTPTLGTLQGARAYGPLLILGLNLDPDVGGDITQQPSGVSLTFTGGTPTATLGNVYDLPDDILVSQSASTDTGTLHGFRNSAVLQPIVYPTSGSLTFSTGTPTVTNSLATFPVTFGMLIRGGTPSLDRGVFPTSASLTLASGTPSITVSEPTALPGSGSLILTGNAPSISRGYYNTFGTLISGRAFIFKYFDYEGTGGLSSLPAWLDYSFNRGATGTGTLTSGTATMFEKVWAIQNTDSEDWTCNPTSTETWTTVTDSTEEWNV